jgi:hypothetical protein
MLQICKALVLARTGLEQLVAPAGKLVFSIAKAQDGCAMCLRGQVSSWFSDYTCPIKDMSENTELCLCGAGALARERSFRKA